MEIVGYIAAILMGLSLGLIGGGGSILTVPILVYFFRQDPLVATTGSLFVVGFTALVGFLTYARHGLVKLKTGFLFAIPSFAGVYLTRNLILPTLPDPILTIFDFVLTKSILVLGSFAFLMLLASTSMIRSGNRNIKVESTQSDQSIFSLTNRGFLVGVVTGFVGAGGGFLIIPALVVILGMPMRLAVGTSLAIITLNSLFAFAISFSNQIINWELLLPIVGLSILGLVVGSYLSPRVDDRKLKTGFGYFVLLMGFAILIDQSFGN